MTMDRSLKVHGGLARTRSVLSRDERLQQMMEEGKFDPEKDSPLGLPKLRLRHSKAGTKTKKAAEEVPAEGAAVEGAAAPAAEGAAKGKGAAPGVKPVAAKGKGEAPKGKAEASKGKGEASKGKGKE